MKNNIIFRKAIAFGVTLNYRVIVGVIAFIVVISLVRYDDPSLLGKILLDIFLTTFYFLAGGVSFIILGDMIFERYNHPLPVIIVCMVDGFLIYFCKEIYQTNQTVLMPMITSFIGGGMFLLPILVGKRLKIINDKHKLIKLTDFNLSTSSSIFSKERISLSGGYGGVPPVWEEYIDTCPKEYRKFLIAFKNKVKSDPSLFKKRAPEIRKELPQKITVGNHTIEIHCHDRGWGDFMSAIVGKREEYQTYAF